MMITAVASCFLIHPNSGFLKQRVICTGIAINEWQNDCGTVSMPKDSIKTRVVTVDTAKHFIILIETLFKDLPAVLFIRQHKLWNDAQLR